MRLCEAIMTAQDTAAAQLANAPEVRMINPVVRRHGAPTAGNTNLGL